MKQISHQKNRGFSLLEALIAALVVGVGMLGLAKMQGITLVNSSDSRIRSAAVNLAQEQMESLRTFANQSTYTALTAGNDTDSSVTGGSTTLNRAWTITACPNAANCRQITTTVSWTDTNGQTQSTQLTTFIAQADPVMTGMVLADASVGGS